MAEQDSSLVTRSLMDLTMKVIDEYTFMEVKF